MNIKKWESFMMIYRRYSFYVELAKENKNNFTITNRVFELVKENTDGFDRNYHCLRKSFHNCTKEYVNFLNWLTL